MNEPDEVKSRARRLYELVEAAARESGPADSVEVHGDRCWTALMDLADGLAGDPDWESPLRVVGVVLEVRGARGRGGG